MRYIKYTIILLFIFLLSNCKEEIEALNQSQQEVDYTLVKAVAIHGGADAPSVKAIGKVASDTEVKLSFKIGGVIASMTAKEGAYIKKGTILANVRSDEIDAQVLKAQRAFQKAQRDLDRIKLMYADSAATLENVQDLTTLVQVSQADLDVARFNQTYAKIIAPVSGRILRRNAEPNELISPGQPVYLLASSGQGTYIMKAALSDRDITRVNYKDKVQMSFDAFPDETFNGQIINIAESADPRTGTFDIEISINNRGKRIRNGLIGSIEIQPKSKGGYFKIPYGAIVEAKDNVLTLYSPIQNDTIASEWKVKAVHVDTEHVLIQESEEIVHKKVITAGAPYLRDGAKIKIQE